MQTRRPGRSDVITGQAPVAKCTLLCETDAVSCLSTQDGIVARPFEHIVQEAFASPAASCSSKAELLQVQALLYCGKASSQRPSAAPGVTRLVGQAQVALQRGAGSSELSGLRKGSGRSRDCPEVFGRRLEPS